MSDLMPKGFSNGQYVDRFRLRDKLYQEDAITMKGVAILNNFPAADVVEARHGSWAWDRRVEAYRCSSCRKHNADRTAYCPNCGAKLKGEKDNG